MPLDDETRRRLQPVQQGLASATSALDALLTAGTGDLSRERKMELLGKTYTEASNYDRHYSTTRSALTGLVITIGLAAASDPIKTVLAIAKPADSPYCLQLGVRALLVHGVMPFVPTLLMFALAIAVNLYFQKFTAACEKIETEIERKLAELAPELQLAPAPRRAGATNITGYLFRADLKAALAETSLWHPEAMKLLLVIAIGVFIAFVATLAWLKCVSP